MPDTVYYTDTIVRIVQDTSAILGLDIVDKIDSIYNRSFNLNNKYMLKPISFKTPQIPPVNSSALLSPSLHTFSQCTPRYSERRSPLLEYTF